MKYLYLLPLLFLIVATSLQAQEQKKNLIDIVEILTKDGNTIIGKIIQADQEKVVLETETLGTITLQKSNIESIASKGAGTSVSKEVEQSINDHTQDATRYYVNSSGFTLKEGEKHYENIGVFFSSFAFGLTDEVTLTVGGEIASLLFGQEFPILYIAPKVGIVQSEKLNISLAATYFDSPGNYFDGVLAVQTAFTVGSRRDNITIGPGVGLSLRNFDFDRDIVVPVSLAFTKSISKSVSLVSDNTFLVYESDSFGVFSMGVRIHFKNGGALNASLWRTSEDWDEIIALPFISAIIPFGSSR